MFLFRRVKGFAAERPLTAAIILLLVMLSTGTSVYSQAPLTPVMRETFEDDPVSGGRFAAQTAGTESNFKYDPVAKRLDAVLDVDFDAASYLSRELPVM